MKNKLISAMLSLVMLLSACALCFTGCASDDTDDTTTSTTSKSSATTLVMWCVTEEGTDYEQAQAVAKAMSELTKSKFKAQLIVKYLTVDEYYDALEAALNMQEQASIEKEEAAARKKEEDKAKKNSVVTETPTPTEEEKEEEDDDTLQVDEDGNPIIDTTVYPDVPDYQVDILYLSGYAKYKTYIENKWIADLSAELTGNSKKIANYVSTALLNAAKFNGKTYAIPNNNVIGEYTYMLIDRELFDKYYYTGMVDSIKGVADIADFLDDIAAYEPDVLPINGNVEYCTNLIADYWDIDPNTLSVTGNFSIIGYAHKSTDKINRGDVVLAYNNLLLDSTYKIALTQLMDYKFKGYFGTPTEGQKCAVSFTTGDAAAAVELSKDYYPVVVQYPLASNDDIYGNMFAVSAFSSNLEVSMEVVSLMNTNAEFRNLFQYGIKGTNYVLNADGTVSQTRANGYHMDLAKTGNEFLAYVPEGTNLDIWNYAKEQNRESLVNPLLGFNLEDELVDESEEANAEITTEDEYAIESIDVAMIKKVHEYSAKVWDRIEKCDSLEKLEKELADLATQYSPSRDTELGNYCKFQIIEPEFEVGTDGVATIKLNEDNEPTVSNTTVKVTATVKYRASDEVDENGETKQESYLILKKTLNPYQVYYRWMQKYGYLPASYAENAGSLN